MTPAPSTPRLTPAQLRLLVALLVLVSVLAGLVGYGIGYHAMTVAALLDSAVQIVGSAVVSVGLMAVRR